MDINIFHHISKEVKIDVFWKKVTTIRKLVNLKYMNDKGLTEHTSDFQALMNQLTSMKMLLRMSCRLCYLIHYLKAGKH